MITAQEVIDWAGLKNLPQGDLAALTAVVSAVNIQVDSLPNIDRINEFDWAETTTLGAIMLAARLYRRRNSAAGIEAVGDTTTYISRYDNDIARLLNIDSFRKPMVG